MYCTNCGAEKGSERRCPFCGARGPAVVMRATKTANRSIGAFVFALLAFMVSAWQLVETLLVGINEGLLGRSGAEELAISYLFLIFLLVLAFEVVFNGSRGSLLLFFSMHSASICYTLITKAEEYENGKAFYYILLLMILFQWALYAILTFAPSLSKTFISCAPTIAALVQIATYPLVNGYHFLATRIQWDTIVGAIEDGNDWLVLIMELGWGIATTLIWALFSYFLTKYFTSFYSDERYEN